MRVSKREMDQNHQRIVKSAGRLMRKRGIETTSVDDVMKKAGLTHGGFYRHFDSKESLVGAAIAHSFSEVLHLIGQFYQELGVEQGAQGYYQHYLSEDHLKHPEMGCPVAALSQDVTRAAASVKKTFSEGFRDVVERLSEAEEGEPEEKRSAATRNLCLLVGAVMIARATEPATSTAVIAACQAA